MRCVSHNPIESIPLGEEDTKRKVVKYALIGAGCATGLLVAYKTYSYFKGQHDDNSAKQESTDLPVDNSVSYTTLYCVIYIYYVYTSFPQINQKKLWD